MIGLSRTASYAAAARGDIPTIAYSGKLKIVPRVLWLKKLGLDPAAKRRTKPPPRQLQYERAAPETRRLLFGTEAPGS
jgi:hypothetical protein